MGFLARLLYSVTFRTALVGLPTLGLGLLLGASFLTAWPIAALVGGGFTFFTIAVSLEKANYNDNISNEDWNQLSVDANLLEAIEYAPIALVENIVDGIGTWSYKRKQKKIDKKNNDSNVGITKSFDDKEFVVDAAKVSQTESKITKTNTLKELNQKER